MPARTARAFTLRESTFVPARGWFLDPGLGRDPGKTDVQQPAPASEALLAEIMTSLRQRFAALNRHYEAAWTESWSHRRCEHAHANLIDAARCAMAHGAGWYVFAVDYDAPRQLTDAEEESVNAFRFGSGVPL